MNKRERMTDARMDVNNVLTLFFETWQILRKLNVYGITDELSDEQVEEIAETAERICHDAFDLSYKIDDIWKSAEKVEE